MIRFGILGTGTIAAKLAPAIAATEGAALAAVGSRAPDRAAAFAERHGVARAHGSAEALVADPDVDVIYVATPNALHREHTLAALAAGKHVLCEKPLAVDAAEAREMVSAARERGLFLMEAMWTLCLPAVRRATELVRGGAIGEPRFLTADFGFASGEGDTGIVFDRALGGGALLDVGIYPVALACALLGRPEATAGLAHIGPEGVDDQQAGVLRFPGGGLALVGSAIRVETPQEAVLSGTAGRLRLPAPFWAATELELTDASGEIRREHHPVEGEGYGCEIAEVVRCLRAGEKESPLLPLEESIAVLEVLDALRAGSCL